MSWVVQESRAPFFFFEATPFPIHSTAQSYEFGSIGSSEKSYCFGCGLKGSGSNMFFEEIYEFFYNRKKYVFFIPFK